MILASMDAVDSGEVRMTLPWINTQINTACNTHAATIAQIRRLPAIYVITFIGIAPDRHPQGTRNDLIRHRAVAPRGVTSSPAADPRGRPYRTSLTRSLTNVTFISEYW